MEFKQYKRGPKKPLLFVKGDKSMKVAINPDEVKYIVGRNAFSIVYLTGGRAVSTKFGLKDWEKAFGKSNLCQIGHSYLVMISKIESFSYCTVFTREDALPLEKEYRKELISKIRILPDGKKFSPDERELEFGDFIVIY